MSPVPRPRSQKRKGKPARAPEPRLSVLGCSILQGVLGMPYADCQPFADRWGAAQWVGRSHAVIDMTLLTALACIAYLLLLTTHSLPPPPQHGRTAPGGPRDGEGDAGMWSLR